MKTIRWFAITLLLVCAAPLNAQVVRTWVSVNGLDSNPCTRALPCRNFDAAVAAVSANGEVVALDSGGYGPVILTKSVSLISPPGVHAAIAPTSDPAITLDGGTQVVVLRGLYLNSKGSTRAVLDNTNGGSTALHVENCRVLGFNTGVRYTGRNLMVHDSSFEDGQFGLELRPNSSGTIPIRVVAERLRFTSIANGITLDGPSSVTAVECEAFSSGAFFVRSLQGRPVELTLERCLLNRGSTAITVFSDGMAGSIATVRLSNSVLVNNNIALSWSNSGCAPCVRVLTRQNNVLEGNNTEGTFTATYAAR